MEYDNINISNVEEIIAQIVKEKIEKLGLNGTVSFSMSLTISSAILPS